MDEDKLHKNFILYNTLGLNSEKKFKLRLMLQRAKKDFEICEYFILYLLVESCGKNGETGFMDGEHVCNLYKLSVGDYIHCIAENDNGSFIGKRVIFTNDGVKEDD